MTQIPSGTKFVGISSTVPTPENRSAQNNSTTEIYTLADLQESVLDLTTPPNDGDVLTYDTGTNAPVWAAPTGSSPTTCIVTIPSLANGTITYSDGRPNATGGIRGMGSSPIELLPQPGANKYYDFSLILEYNHVTTAYTTNLISVACGDNISYGVNISSLLGDAVFLLNSPNVGTNSGYPEMMSMPLDTAVTLTTNDLLDPTLGDGTLRAIITYTERTFGA